MLTLSHLIDDIHLGRPATHGGLTLFPLLCSDPADPPEYELLDDAVALGSVQITEISESGSVSELLVWNNGDKPVLIVDGQELLGAKQNRVINLTVLAPERSKTTIPVSCVEAGRWSFSSNEFRPAPHTQFAAGRAAKAAQVTGAMETSGERRSNQTAVWDVIAQRSAQMSVRSDTGAMAAMYLQSAPQIEEYATAFAAVPGQVGAAFLSCGQITGIDIFDRSSTFASISDLLIWVKSR